MYKRFAYLFILVSLTLLGRTALAESEIGLKRVVSTSGALTEIVYALKAESLLVGVDTTSQYPEAAKQLAQVGYQRQLSAEGLLSLKPDLVLATTEAGSPTVLAQLQTAGVKLLILPAKHSTQGVIDKIQGVAKALNRESAGQALVAKFEEQLKTVQLHLPVPEHKLRAVFLMNMGKGSPLAAGKETAAHAMLDLAGANNVFAASYSGYKPISAEAMIAANPSVILMSKDTLDAMGGVDKVIQTAGIELTEAGKQRRIVTFDGLHLLGFGPRLPEAIQTIAHLLYPSS